MKQKVKLFTECQLFKQNIINTEKINQLGMVAQAHNLKQEERELEASLDYIARPCLKKQNKILSK
jgi:F420-dependent methylenetetrahydromethanopterin dehydrogenase